MSESERPGQFLSRQPARGLGGVPLQGGAGGWAGLLENYKRGLWDNLRKKYRSSLGLPPKNEGQCCKSEGVLGMGWNGNFEK